MAHLLHEHPQKPVPEPLDESTPTGSAGEPEYPGPLNDDHPGPWTPRPEGDEPQYVELPPPPDSEPVQLATNSTSHAAPPPVQMTDLEAELTHLQGQVSELARTQLEAHLAEIRHMEQLLSTHQTTRMIEDLQHEVDELKGQRAGSARIREFPSAPSEAELVPPAASHGDVNPPDSVGDQSEPDQRPAVAYDRQSITTNAPRQAASPPLARVRISNTPAASDRYDVEADEAPLPEFLAQLGPMAGWNLVSGPEMQGTVTCRWKGVDLKQALIQLLHVHGWQMREDGDFAIIEQLPRRASVSPDAARAFPDEAGDSAATITLQLAPEVTGLFPPASVSAKSHPITWPSVESPAIRPPFGTGSRQISFGSGGHASPRRGRIVMKDYPELMAQRTPSDSPRVETSSSIEIEATILEIRPAPGAAPGIYRQALSVAGRGPCPRCGIVHAGPAGVGHAVDGWVTLGEGLSSGVCHMTPEMITAQLKQHATTTLTATPRVQVLNGQLAEIALTEQPGFRRQIVRSENESPVADAPGRMKLTLRSTVGVDGMIRLDLQHSSSTSTEFSASLNVPPDSCVVLGGLHFEIDQSAATADQATAKDLYEVVVLIRVHPLGNVGLTTPEPQAPTAP